MKTYSAKPETVKREWFVVDAAEKRWVVWPLRLLTVLKVSTSQNTLLTLILAITSSLSMQIK